MATDPLIAVTGSDRPYVFDLPQVLSLPPGLEFRFRYRADWIDREVLDALSRTKGGLAGDDLWLFFHSRMTKRLLPLRRCKVVKLERLGPVYYLRFRVGEFPCWKRFPRPAPPPRAVVEDDTQPPAAEDNSPREAHDHATCPRCIQADAVTEEARKLILASKRHLARRLPDGRYLCFGKNEGSALEWHPKDESPEAPMIVSRHWGDAIDLLAHGEPELWGVPLFYLLGFQGADQDAWLNAAPLHSTRTSLATHGYELVQGKRYRMRVVEWRQDRPEHSLVKINCVFDPEVLRLEGSWDLVVGKYDVPEFTFSALRRGYSEVAIATSPLPAVDAEGREVLATASGRSPQPSRGAVTEEQQLEPAVEGDTEGTRATIVAAQEKAEKRAGWPSYYSARVPVKVKLGPGNVAKVGSLVCLGLFAFVMPHLKLWDAVTTGIGRSAIELVGLLLLTLGGGKFAKDYASLGGSIYRIPGLGGHGGS
jgi:hypothetical protein